MGWFNSRSPYSSHSTYRPSYSRGPGSHYSSHSHSSSYYKRRPRDGYIQRLIHQLRRLLRELYNYARRHPVKLFFMVLGPLLSSGALHGILRQYGISLPRALNGALGGPGLSNYGSRSYSSGYYGSTGYGREYDSEGLNFQSLMSLAKLARYFV